MCAKEIRNERPHDMQLLIAQLRADALWQNCYGEGGEGTMDDPRWEAVRVIERFQDVLKECRGWALNIVPEQAVVGISEEIDRVLGEAD